MSPSTPKFKSGEFKAALARLKEAFDAQSLAVILMDALERKAAEQIFAKSGGAGGQKARLKSVAKTELVGQITGWFFAAPQVAYLVMKELDRSCQKERHIVASIPEAQAADRVGSYRAIALKRERAKFVWALARDDRDDVRKLAINIINEFFEEVASFEKAKEISEGEGRRSGLGSDRQLATRIKDQAERLGEATMKVSRLETKLSTFEAERAHLLVQMGAKERFLKRQSEKRSELEEELNSLKTRFQSFEEEQFATEIARKAEQEARTHAEDLAQKVRRLEKLAGASEALSDLQDALEASNRRHHELIRQSGRTEIEYQRERERRKRESDKLKGETEALREELKRTRKHVTELEERPLGDAKSAAEDGVNIFLDQANIAGVAHQVYRRKVNFAGLIDQLREGRRIAKAVAFVVDNGGSNFDSFCDVLRRAGWELRIKKPKTFADGRSKADWDMGIAMEALDWRDQASTAIIVSGDGDFAPLIRRLQRSGQSVEVACFAEGLAKDAREVSDRVHLLNNRSLEA